MDKQIATRCYWPLYSASNVLLLLAQISLLLLFQLFLFFSSILSLLITYFIWFSFHYCSFFSFFHFHCASLGIVLLSFSVHSFSVLFIHSFMHYLAPSFTRSLRSLATSFARSSHSLAIHSLVLATSSSSSLYLYHSCAHGIGRAEAPCCAVTDWHGRTLNKILSLVYSFVSSVASSAWQRAGGGIAFRRVGGV